MFKSKIVVETCLDPASFTTTEVYHVLPYFEALAAGVLSAGVLSEGVLTVPNSFNKYPKRYGK